jgi:hypothetical protein
MRRNTKKQRQYGRLLQLSRRHLLAGGGSAAVISALGTVRLAHAASETLRQSARPTLSPLPAPSPIPGGLEVPDVGLVHGFIPGPESSVTPFAGLPAMGLDIEPSTLTNYQGFTTFAVLSGQTTSSDGQIYNVEFDVRVMAGEYVAEDGSRHRGTFGFF